MGPFGIAGTLVVLTSIWAVTRTVRSDAAPSRKALWVGIVLLLPFVGFVAWIIFGPS